MRQIMNSWFWLEIVRGASLSQMPNWKDKRQQAQRGKSFSPSMLWSRGRGRQRSRDAACRCALQSEECGALARHGLRCERGTGPAR
mmetsp:Transcript_21325/g.40133  ORF Transcript_21325/g.40133 Transcript_21325/m.40133 type:complete len:86 (+) Transcript_21325:146-403(+)